MNRRGFLRLLSGAAAAAILPLSMALRTPRLEVERADDVGLVMSLDDFARKYIEPAMRTLAEKIESDIYASMT